MLEIILDAYGDHKLTSEYVKGLQVGSAWTWCAWID